VQSANGIYSEEDRAQIQVEVSQLVQEVDRISSQAQFNGMNLLTGRFSQEGIKFQIGANMDQNISVNIDNMSASALGLKGSNGSGETSLSVASQDEANISISTIDSALKVVLKQRANLGATMNRADMAKKGIDISAENLTASESRIRDTDMAKEMTDYTKNAILQQAGTAMLAQANNSAQNVLTLLK
jgi:flagellin